MAGWLHDLLEEVDRRIAKMKTDIGVTGSTLDAGQLGGALPPSVAGTIDHGGLLGLADDDHTIYAKKASNLSDLASAATARTNLGLNQLIVQEVDGAPAELEPVTLEFPNGTLTEPSAGVVRYTPTTPSSGTDLGWFNVEDYGAVDDNSTDSTTAFQAAIDAAEAAGGGTVYAPGRYVIAGALQDTGRSNSQLLLPRLHVTSGEQITIRIKGRVAPPQVPSVATAIVTPDEGSMIRGTLNAGAGGALFGAWGPSGSFGDFSMVHVIFEDITIRMPANPVLSALNLSHVAAAELHNVMVDAGEYEMTGISEPSTSTSFGVRLPGNNNGAWIQVRSSAVVGYYNGWETAEHLDGDGLQVWGCKIGLTLVATNHASHVRRMLVVACERVVKVTGLHYFEIEQLDIEHADDASWRITDYDLDDGSNLGIGAITWHAVLQNVGPHNSFTKNSGTGVQTTKLGTAPTDTDEKAKVSADDTTAGYLNGKLLAGTGITLTEGSPGGNETLTIAATATGTVVLSQIHEHVIGEDLTAETDSAKVTFLTANEFEPETLAAYLNGARQRPVTDYTEDAGYQSITFAVAPTTADELILDYVAA